ncbi:MAG: LCP family protein, partial [Acidobacteria bacterium]|nr:LCP family protein [Acidobacteriota bacterium]
MLLALVVIAGLALAAYSLHEFDRGAAAIPRVHFALETPEGEAVDVQAGEPVNYLLVGTDNSEGIDPDDPILEDRDLDSQLTDVLMVLRFDPETGQAAVLSIPRDLRVDYATAGSGKINAAYGLGEASGAGQIELGQTIINNLDIPIHKYLEINFAGFAKLVDAIDGVSVYFEYAARDDGSGLYIPAAGCWILDGDQALAYVRGRSYAELIDDEWVITGGDDFRRSERQRDFLVLAADKAVNKIGRNPSSIRQFLNGIEDANAIKLDDATSIQEMIDLAQSFAGFTPENLQRLSLPVYDYTDGTFDLGIIEDQADSVLDIFRGESSLSDASSVLLTIDGDEPEIDALSDVGFVLDETEPEALGLEVDAEDTVLIVSPDRLGAARTVGSWLTQLPTVLIVEGTGVTHLHLGSDYAGSREVIREDDDVSLAGWLADLGIDDSSSGITTIDTSSTTTTAQVTDGSADGAG